MTQQIYACKKHEEDYDFCPFCRIEELEIAIKDFAKGQAHAVDDWKNAKHIKPLFKIAKGIK